MHVELRDPDVEIGRRQDLLSRSANFERSSSHPAEKLGEPVLLHQLA
jgi:hypothetical protein